MNVSIILVNWNSVDYLVECIGSICEYTRGVTFEIIVVDNASPRDDIGILEAQFPNIRVIRSPKNLGFAGANNLGFLHSVGEHILFLNPDTKMIGPTISILLKHMNALPDAGVVGCKLLNSDFTVQLSSIQKFPTILNQALDAEYLQLRWPQCSLWEIGPLFSDHVRPIQVRAISGACMLLRRTTFENVGMFSEEYFMYAEDIDLNYKLTRAGFTNYYVGETAMIHYGGGSSSRQEVKEWAVVMKMCAMMRLFQKMRGRKYAQGYRAAMATAALVRLAIVAVVSFIERLIGRPPSFGFAARKWKAIFRWAVAYKDAAFGSR